MRALNREGTEFPVNFQMKRLSLTSLMCRHPVASGFMHVLIGSLLYGPVTWGRLLFVTVSTFMVIWRVSHEERELLNSGG
jgi:protein-S-isoprenylcysteine O-methyltransferase Ste14